MDYSASLCSPPKDAAVLGKVAALAYNLEHKLLYTLRSPPKLPSEERAAAQRREYGYSAKDGQRRREQTALPQRHEGYPSAR